MFITLGGQEDPNCMWIIIEKKSESTEHTHAQDYTFCNCIVSEMQKHKAHALASHNTHKSTSHRHNSYLCNVKQCNMISQSPYYSIQWQPPPNCIEWQWPGGKKRQTPTNHLLASKLNDIRSNLQVCVHYSTNCTFGLQESSIAQCIYKLHISNLQAELQILLALLSHSAARSKNKRQGQSVVIFMLRVIS